MKTQRKRRTKVTKGSSPAATATQDVVSDDTSPIPIDASDQHPLKIGSSIIVEYRYGSIMIP